MNHDDKRSKNLTNLVATDASRNHLRRQGRSDRSIREIFSELVLIVGLLVRDKPWIDAEARAGLCAAADGVLLRLMSIPAADLGDLETKVIAYGTGQPLNPARTSMTPMLDAAILADIRRLKPADAPAWLASWCCH